MDFFYYCNRPCPLCARYRVALCRNMIICDDCQRAREAELLAKVTNDVMRAICDGLGLVQPSG
jgi:hypothetical protein